MAFPAADHLKLLRLIFEMYWSSQWHISLRYGYFEKTSKDFTHTVEKIWTILGKKYKIFGELFKFILRLHYTAKQGSN